MSKQSWRGSTLLNPEPPVLVSCGGLEQPNLCLLYTSYSYYSADAEMAEKASIYGALTLYLDFINIFLYVVRPVSYTHLAPD